MNDASADTSVRAPASFASILGWGAYLAASWTWCIGMFLPTLLVRDYGFWGFVVFALPNVVGAAAMGWVLRQGASERVVDRHRVMLRQFSIVTIAFQWSFLTWLLEMAPVDWRIFGAAAVLVCGIGFYRLPRSVCVPLAACVLALSLMTLGVVAIRGIENPLLALIKSERLTPQPRPGLEFLAPVCAFGFALCPYLDLTFHRARQRFDERGARAAFTIGFGVLFFAMIVLTYLYAPAFDLNGLMTPWGSTLATTLVLVHIYAQLAFTCGVHNQELIDPEDAHPWWRMIQSYGLLEGLTFALLITLSSKRLLDAALPLSWQAHLPMPLREIIYRCFMSFYGLVFPAYVWLCMIPTRDGHSGIDGARGRLKLAVCAAACLLAAPCYWMGFVERQTWWLVPGLGVVLVARLVVRRTRGISDPPSPA